MARPMNQGRRNTVVTSSTSIPTSDATRCLTGPSMGRRRENMFRSRDVCASSCSVSRSRDAAAFSLATTSFVARSFLIAIVYPQELAIRRAPSLQFLVGALGRDLPLFEHQDAVREEHR